MAAEGGLAPSCSNPTLPVLELLCPSCAQSRRPSGQGCWSDHGSLPSACWAPAVGHVLDLLCFLLEGAQFLLGYLPTFTSAQTPASCLDATQDPTSPHLQGRPSAQGICPGLAPTGSQRAESRDSTPLVCSGRSSDPLVWMTFQHFCIKHSLCARHSAGPRGRGSEQDRLVPAVAELIFW